MIARLTRLDVRLNFRLTYRRYYASKPETLKSKISTLLPQKLRPTDMLEGFPQAFEKYYQEPIPQHPENSLALRHRGSCIDWEPRPPPKSCRGFLYYHEPEPASRLAGSVRFRLTPSFDPDTSPQAAFAAGSDLQIPKAGLPWSVPLWTLLRVPSLAYFRDVLHADGVQTIDPKSKVIADLNETSVLLYALGQPFLVEFHMFYLRVYLFRGTGPALCGRIEVGFIDPTSPSYRQPYLGMNRLVVVLCILTTSRAGRRDAGATRRLARATYPKDPLVITAVYQPEYRAAGGRRDTPAASGSRAIQRGHQGDPPQIPRPSEISDGDAQKTATCL